MQKISVYVNQIKNFKITRKIVIQIFLVLLLSIIFSLVYFNLTTISLYLHNFGNIFNSGLQLYSIYVGQGDSSFIILPNKTSILIDTGTEEYAEKFCYELESVMEANNIEKIDYMFLTHPHSDHIGGALKVFEQFEVVNIFRPIICSPLEENLQGYEESDDFLYIEVLERAEQEGNVEFILPNEKNFDDYILKIWTPLSTNYSDLNDYSPIITIQNAENSLMFTGDLTIDGEAEFLNTYKDIEIDVDVLKVAHHGSENATSAEFLEKVNPEIAIISAGVDNIYNFPNDQLMQRLNDSGVNKILSTNMAGTIGMSVSGSVYNFATGFIFHDRVVFVVIYFILLFAIFSVKKNGTLKKVERIRAGSNLIVSKKNF